MAIYTTTRAVLTNTFTHLHAHTHMHSQLCCILQNWSNITTAGVSDQLLTCFLVYADLNQ